MLGIYGGNKLNTQSEIEQAPVELEHLCPVHIIRLTHLLAGGAGHCKSCGLFVQSLNHPMPELSAEFLARREAAMAEARRIKRNSAARARRTTKQRGTVEAAAQTNGAL